MEHQMLDFYRRMFLLRRFEEEAIELYKQGLIGGSYHAYIGQEAVAVGVCSALRFTDYMTNTYRGRGQHLAKGADPKLLFAEIMGRADGYCKGKGGPMHITDLEHGIIGTNGIVAAGIPIAVGAALKAKMTESDQVSVTFFGDGATNQGAFFEALNLAALWELPVLFICENNGYAEMTPISGSMRQPTIVDRGKSFGIPSVTVDGNDVEAVYQVATDAVQRAREGRGPTLIEAITYRLQGHMFGDAETYRSKQEVKEAWDKEPIRRLREKIFELGISQTDAISKIEADVNSDLKEALDFALSSPEPAVEEIFTDVL